MATNASTQAANKAQPPREPASKRKQSMSDDESDSDSDSPSGSPKKRSSITSTGKISSSQQLVPVPGQPDAPLVTKRTLQNRKAQREFRKRREARVRELEERCRRFDQMGLEANAELQRLARRLKDENEALKSLVARLGFAHMIPAVIESLNGPEQHPSQQLHHPHSRPAHDMPQTYAPLEMGMDAWARSSGPAASHQFNVPTSNLAGEQRPTSVAANKSSKSTNSAASGPATSAPISSLSNLPGLTELLPITAGGVNPSLLSDANANARKQSPTSAESRTAAIAVPATIKSTTTARPIEDNNSTFDNDWFAQLAQSGQDKDEADVGAAPVNASSTTSRDERSSVNPILSLNLNNSDNNKSQNKSSDGLNPNSALTGSAMLGANARDFGLGLASALGMPPSTTNNNIFPMPMPTHQDGALLNPNPIPFAFNLSENKMPGDQSWWSQVAGNTLEGDDSILDEKAQAVAQATAANNGAPSPFDLSAFLNGGLTPGGGFTFGSQQTLDGDDSDGTQKNNGKSPSDDDKKPNNGKAGETQQLTQAEHAQMFLRLLEAKMAKRSTSPYAQLGFQPPSHQQQYAASQAGPSFSDASSSSSSSSGNNASGAKVEDDFSLSPINVYSRLAQHPAFLSTNASELEELVDSISSTQRQ